MTSYQKLKAKNLQLQTQVLELKRQLNYVCVHPDSPQTQEITHRVRFDAGFERAVLFGDSEKKVQTGIFNQIDKMPSSPKRNLWKRLFG